jgi:hypothetical protein
MIILDPPVNYHGRFKGCSHLISDQSGEAGTLELLAFAKRAGLQEGWIQERGTYKEHFDVFGAKRARCIELGARDCSRVDFVAVYRAKRSLAAERATAARGA